MSEFTAYLKCTTGEDFTMDLISIYLDLSERLRSRIKKGQVIFSKNVTEERLFTEDLLF